MQVGTYIITVNITETKELYDIGTIHIILYADDH